VQLDFENPDDVEKALQGLMDPNYVEHDTFAIFENLMKLTGQWFIVTASNQPAKRPRGSSIGPLTESALHEEGNNPLVMKCKRIQHLLLKNKDVELYQHLESLKIEAQIYLLKWVRLLFGREFHLDDLLLIWDAIFAYSVDLSLVDYLCIAMLIFIRTQLLPKDYTGCMSRLLKYPPVEDVHFFVKQARNLAENKPFQQSPKTGGIQLVPRQVTVSDFDVKPASKPQAKGASGQQLTPVTLAPSFKHNLVVDTTTRDVAELQSQLRTLRDTQLAVAQNLDGIVTNLQKTLLENTSLSGIDTLLIGLAELKQAKDILTGFLPLSFIIPEDTTSKDGKSEKSVDPEEENDADSDLEENKKNIFGPTISYDTDPLGVKYTTK